MNYLLQKAVKRAKKNAKKYIPLVLQIIIGVCMISLSLTVALNFSKQMGEFQKELVLPFAGVSTRMPGDADNITLDDWEYIKASYASEGLTYYKQYYAEEFFNIVFADDGFYKNIMGMKDSPQKETVFVGKNAQDSLVGWKPNDKNLAKNYDEARAALFGFQISDFVLLESVEYEARGLLSAISYMEDSMNIASFDDFIILPLSAAGDMPCQSIVAIPIKSGEENTVSTTLTEIQAYIISQHPSGDYIVRNYGEEMQQALSRNNILAGLINFLAAFVLAIVALGLTGLLLVFINKRKREFAVSLMCGATYRQLIAEVFFEILSVVLLGTVLGNLLCIPFLPLFGGIGVATGYSVLSLVICVSGGMALSAAVYFMSLHKIKHISPVHTLKDL